MLSTTSKRPSARTRLRPPFDTPQWPLAIDKVRHVGEPLAVVIAATPEAARDAAAAVDVHYDILPAVTDARTAISAGAPVLHDAVPDNIALDAEFGSRDAIDAAFAQAEIVVAQTFRNQRIVNAQMEPRAALGAYDAVQDTLHADLRQPGRASPEDRARRMPRRRPGATYA